MVSEGKRLAKKRQNKVRRQRMKGGSLTGAEFYEVKDYYGWRCAYCGAQSTRPGWSPPNPVKLHEDHVVPLSTGGRHDATNVVPCCATCNARKADLSLLMWLHRDGGDPKPVRNRRERHHDGR